MNKLKFPFSLSNSEIKKETSAVEEIDGRELEYKEAIRESEAEYAEEILKVQGQIDEAAKEGKNEEVERLRKLIIALQEGSQKVRQNLEEVLIKNRKNKTEKIIRDTDERIKNDLGIEP